jgi:hypothetical protein
MEQEADPVYVDELDIPLNRLSDAAHRVVSRAIDDVRRRQQPLLTCAHLVLAIAHADWDPFAQAMHLAAVNPRAALRAVDARVSPPLRLVCKLALTAPRAPAR